MMTSQPLIYNYRLPRFIARPMAAAILLYAVAIAYGGGLWFHLLHEWRGGRELVELPPVLHWLRDSTLALPAILLAVWVALSVWPRMAGRLAPKWHRAALVTLVALATTFAFAAGVPVHAALFVGEHSEHSEHSHAPASDQVAFTYAGVPVPLQSGANPETLGGQAAFLGGGDDHAEEGIVGSAAHAAKDGATALPVIAGITLLATLLLGAPAQLEESEKLKRFFRRNSSQAPGQPGRFRVKVVATLMLSVIVPALVLAFGSQQQAVASV